MVLNVARVQGEFGPGMGMTDSRAATPEQSLWRRTVPLERQQSCYGSVQRSELTDCSYPRAGQRIKITWSNICVPLFRDTHDMVF